MTNAADSLSSSYPATELYSADITLNLCDFALFSTVMKRREAYQNTLSLILEEPDIRIREVKVEQVFLNMTSKNGSKELVSLLQYMKNTDINNPEIEIKDKRLLELDNIVSEVKESEEWEAVKMNILDVGILRGINQGEFKK